MKWASAVSIESDTASAVGEVVSGASRALDGGTLDLAVLFVSPHHVPAADAIAGALEEELRGAVVLGCSAGGVVAGGREIEQSPGLGLTVASMPNVSIRPFQCQMEDLASIGGTEDWLAALGVAAPPKGLILLPDPFSIDAEAVLTGLDSALPQTVKIGGLASGGSQPGENALFLGSAVQRSGLVGIALDGDLRIESVVAQGCRPIGEPMFVTGSDRNLVRQLDGRPAFEVLQELVDVLSPADLELAKHSLFAGLVMHRNREEYGPGDFLIRNLVGVDPESGVVGIGGLVEDGAVLQFHLRDAATSAEDLRNVLQRHRDESAGSPCGGLMFSCLGRGAGLYGKPDHDTQVLRECLGPVPLGGFFCNGEIGPVQGRTYLHGYTSAFALFRPEKA